jgi:acylphosphatase
MQFLGPGIGVALPPASGESRREKEEQKRQNPVPVSAHHHPLFLVYLRALAGAATGKRNLPLLGSRETPFRGIVSSRRRTVMPTASVAWRAHGLVQGVGFRYFTLRQAQSLGLVGWVRNLRDGTVEVVARGEASAVEQLHEILTIGPRSSQVDRLEPFPIPAALEESTDFAIK